MFYAYSTFQCGLARFQVSGSHTWLTAASLRPADPGAKLSVPTLGWRRLITAPQQSLYPKWNLGFRFLVFLLLGVTEARLLCCLHEMTQVPCVHSLQPGDSPLTRRARSREWEVLFRESQSTAGGAPCYWVIVASWPVDCTELDIHRFTKIFSPLHTTRAMRLLLGQRQEAL